MVSASLLNATAATIKSYLAGCDPPLALTKQNVALSGFHFVVFSTFFLGGILTTANLRKDYYEADFPLKPVINPLISQDGFVRHRQCPVPWGQRNKERYLEKVKRVEQEWKIGQGLLCNNIVILPGFTSGRADALVHIQLGVVMAPIATHWLRLYAWQRSFLQDAYYAIATYTLGF
jgi:hypothetical protein